VVVLHREATKRSLHSHVVLVDRLVELRMLRIGMIAMRTLARSGEGESDLGVMRL
jgi:hypothetical protein